MVGPGPATHPAPPQSGASAGVGQGLGAEPAAKGLAHRDTLRSEPWPEEWLLIEWPAGAAEPGKYWLSNLPPRTALKDLVHTAKACWRIERDYQELKQEIGLGHYEGRGWRGFHHRASLCIAAYGFLVAERCLSPPQARFTARRRKAAALLDGVQPRGAGPA